MSKNKLSVLTGLIWLTWLILGAHRAEPVSISAAHFEENAPLMFIENVGQFADDARFQVWGGSNTMWLAEDALWMTVVEANNEVPQGSPPIMGKPGREPTSHRKGVNLKLSFVDANPQPEIEPFNLLETKMNYFLGNDSDKWRSNVPVYGGVRYKDIYPGIDLELTSENAQTVQRFVATEDADLDAVRLRVEGAAAEVMNPDGAGTLTLLHNNDGESALLANTNSVAPGTGYPNTDTVSLEIGGVAAFKSVMDREIASAEGNDNAVVTVYAGDAFLASATLACSLNDPNIAPYDSVAQQIAYDAHILGNHEFDYSPDFLERFIEGFDDGGLTQPFLSANLDFSGEAGFDDLVDADGVIVGAVTDGRVVAHSLIMTDTNQRFGIVGATTWQLPTISSPRNVSVTNDIMETATVVQQAIDDLYDNHGVRKIIFVSHLQYVDNDEQLIGLLSDVDVAVAGGGDELLVNSTIPTMTQLLPGERASIQGEYPLEVTDADGDTVYVVTTVGNYKYLGRIDVTFDADGEVTGFNTETSYPRRVIPDSDAGTALGLTDTVTMDANIVTSVNNPVEACLEDLANTPIARSEILLDVSRNTVRGSESNAGNMIADSFVYAYEQYSNTFGLRAGNTPIIALQNGGGIRQNAGDQLPTEGAPGTISQLDTINVLPFDNFLTAISDVTPEELKEVLERAASGLPGASGRFLQMAGLHVTYNSDMEVGSRVISAMLTDGTMIVEDGAVVAGAPTIMVLTDSFVARGGDGYSMLADNPQSRFFDDEGNAIAYEQPWREYIQSFSEAGDPALPTIPDDDPRYQPGGEGRITILTPTSTSTPTRTPTATRTPTPTPTSANTPTPELQTDPYEPDNTCEDATTIPTDGTIQVHTFHQQADDDWVRFEATKGVEYLIEGRVPPNSPADLILQAYADCESVPGSQDPPFSVDIRYRITSPIDGDLHLHLLNGDRTTYGSDVEYHLSVRALDGSAQHGALVIVAGKYEEEDELQSNIHHVTNQVYQLFRSQGHPAEQIYYLATDLNLDASGDGASDVDSLASGTNLQTALTVWARDYVGPDRALTLFMMDHGAHDKLYLDGPRGEWLTPQELDEWLNELEDETGAKVNVLIEACSSGSFIDLSQTISKEGRVIVTATDAYAPSYASEEGAAFSDALLSALAQGMNLKAAFDEGVWAVEQLPQLGQVPWLDSDGNGFPNQPSDYPEAERRGFAITGSFPSEQWSPYIQQAEIRYFNGTTGQIWAQVLDDEQVEYVWAVVYPPSYEPPESSEEIVPEPPRISLLKGQEVDYGAEYSTDWFFAEDGDYQVVIYATDDLALEARPVTLDLQVGTATLDGMLFLPLVTR